MRDWDPNGIAHYEDAPEDEYDRYARTLCGDMFGPDFSAERVENYLTEITEKHMGLPSCRDQTERAARALVALRNEVFGAD